MFNVLGKLQSEILSGEKRQAVSTLSQYSKLLRYACSISGKESISLSEEASFLSGYLKLEQERFIESPFQFSISGFDTDLVLIEPFLLQPFIELAVLGGLGSKEHFVKIEFDQTLNSINITSEMINVEVIEKLWEKCGTAHERLKLFNHVYKLSHHETRYSQNIFLKTSGP